MSTKNWIAWFGTLAYVFILSFIQYAVKLMWPYAKTFESEERENDGKMHGITEDKDSAAFGSPHEDTSF